MATYEALELREAIRRSSLEDLVGMRDELPADGPAIVRLRDGDTPIINAPRCVLVDEGGREVDTEDAREALTEAARERAMESTDVDMDLLASIDDDTRHDWWDGDAAARLIAEEAEAAGLTPAQLDAALQQGLPDGTTTREVVRGAVERCTPIEAMDHVELSDFVAELFATVPDVHDDPDGFGDAQAVYDRIERRAVEIIQGANSWTEVAWAADALADAARKMSDASLENAR